MSESETNEQPPSDSDKECRNDSILLHGHHKPNQERASVFSIGKVTPPPYTIVKIGSEPPKSKVLMAENGTPYVVGCGTAVAIARCPHYEPKTDHTRDVVVHTCKSMRCETCNAVALKRQVASSIMPHNALNEVLELVGQRIPDRHVVVSPPKQQFPKDLIESEGTKPAWDWYTDFLRSYNVGFLAVSAVIHLYRKKHYDDHTGCDDPQCTRDHYLQYGLHFHNAGKMYLKNTTEIQKDFDGKLFVQKMDDKYGVRSIGATLKYELNHAHPVVKRDTGRAQETIHRFGEISKRKMHRELIRNDLYPVPCKGKGCIQSLLEYEIDHSDMDMPEKEGICAGLHSKTDQVWSYQFDRFPNIRAVVHTEHELETMAYRYELHGK